MKKTFPLELPNRKPARVIDAIKHEVRKYVKRERRKKLPDGVDFWDFDCRIGRDSKTAETAHVAELNDRIQSAAEEEGPAIYIEILAKPGIRRSKPGKANPESEAFSEEKD